MLSLPNSIWNNLIKNSDLRGKEGRPEARKAIQVEEDKPGAKEKMHMSHYLQQES